MTLPDEAPGSWSSETLKLRYSLPKIWTQKAGRQFGIYWSDKIRFGRLWPEPTREEMDSFYNIESYSRYLAGIGGSKRSPRPSLVEKILTKAAWMTDRSATDPLSTILTFCPQSRSICDIGCGSGAFLEKARDAGLAPTGIDPSPVSAASVRGKGISFFEGTAELLPENAIPVDVVTMFQSLEHCRDPLLAVKNAASLTSQDGLIIIDVPNMECIGFDVYGPAWWHTDAGRHLQFFTQNSLQELMKLAGLEIVKWEFEGGVLQFTAGGLRDMQEVWDAIRPTTHRPSARRTALYLPRALLASPNKRYEVIRLYARKAPQTARA